MSTIGPGTLLICVDAGNGTSSRKRGLKPPITVGSLYICNSVTTTICMRDGCNNSVSLNGLGLQFFCMNRFKPFIDGLDEEIKEEEKEPQYV